jgi:molybdopterin-guanine dinucleotide biosynthesis protein MobB
VQQSLCVHRTIHKYNSLTGTGKTSLLRKLLPLLCERGICVGMIMHAPDNFDIDKPGKDSFELRKAGAQQMLVTSNQRWALMVEREYEH